MLEMARVLLLDYRYARSPSRTRVAFVRSVTSTPILP